MDAPDLHVNYHIPLFRQKRLRIYLLMTVYYTESTFLALVDGPT